MRFPRNVKSFTGQLDTAPFAGVFFLLVLFLLLNSYLVPPQGVRIRLPEGSTNWPGAATPSVVVAVDRDEQYYFDRQAVQEADLKVKLKAKAKTSMQPLVLMIQADDAVRHGALVRLERMAHEAGIPEVWIQTSPPLFPAATKGAGSR